MNWFHHFFNPHCPHCTEERRELNVCNSCETLKLEIERLRLENEKLINRILEKPAPIVERAPSTEELKQMMPSRLPWNARKQLLEQEDRHKAKLLKSLESTEDLEKELLEAGGEN